jgi:DNA primase
VSRYTADSRDRVFDAVDMVALVETRVDLRRAALNSYFGLCPFHDERTPSFHIRPDEKHYHCFGCAESGDPFKFVMETEGLDFKGALESLAGRFGVTLEVEEEDPEEAARRTRRERLYGLLGRAATYYERVLWEADEAQAAREYLTTRGLEPEMLREFGIGYALNAWDRLVVASRRAGFSDEELLAAGLAQPKRDRPDELLDRFRGRIMFPTSDPRGRVRGFGARTMGLDRGPKYLNTNEGDLYHKREVLYGIQLARMVAAKAGRMVLAEGYTDVIALHQAGVRNAVGIMGTSLTREQVDELARLVRVLELCLDADRAGQEAMLRAARLCADKGLELRVVQLPPGADPGDMVARDGGASMLRELVSKSVPFVVFEVERLLEAADLASAEGKDRAIGELRPALAGTPQSVLRDELVARIAEAMGLAQERLVALLGEGAPVAGIALPGLGGGSAGGGAAQSQRTPGGSRGGGGPRGGQHAPVASPPSVAAAHDLRLERAFLSMCIAAPARGQELLSEIDPDLLFAGELMRRAARHLETNLDAPLQGLPDGDDELTAAVADLDARAARGGTVERNELEHARLLLERARLDRLIAIARLRGAGESGPSITDLSRERQAIQVALAAVLSRLEKPV